LTNTTVGIQISVLQGSASGTAVYVETQTATTNANGLLSLQIGMGTASTGTFAGINWAAGTYFIKTETDPQGGSNYSITGSQEMLSVPYAMYAKNGFSNGTEVNQMLYWNGTAWVSLAPGNNGQVLSIVNGSLTWATTAGIVALDCSSSIQTGTLTESSAASSVSVSVPYTGGNSGTYATQTVSSTGVSGLTATLSGGLLSAGIGSLSFTIEGTPSAVGTASFAILLAGQSCSFTVSVTPNVLVLGTLNCSSSTQAGTLTEDFLASNVSVSIPYTGASGGYNAAQSINSTGVSGLTANFSAGYSLINAGSVIYTITGVPSAAGTATFAITLGGKSCTITKNVLPNTQYPASSVHCTTAALVVSVTNPSTGKIWMDRNLGASQVADSSGKDITSRGDFYQWGRRSDGHQCRDASIISTTSSVDQPAHGSWIYVNIAPLDWRIPQNNNLWQGVNGVNNPCPNGFRVPTEAEWNTERLSWISNDGIGAFASVLKLCGTGQKYSVLTAENDHGKYWSSTVSGTESFSLNFYQSDISIPANVSAFGHERFRGYAVRCIKN
jgi:uncharacterized protein (TIGR02145 family)